MAEKASSGLTLDQRFSLLADEHERLRQLQQTRSTRKGPTPKIQKVPGYLRDRESVTQHYLPKLASFGPIHHGDSKLQLGEKYKLTWTAMYVNRTKQNEKDLHQRIVNEIKELKGLFTDDLFTAAEFMDFEKQGFKSIDEKISWMLVVDGCSMIQIMDKGHLDKPDDYCQLHLKLDQLILLQQDMLLLENQIPYRVLKLLLPKDDSNAAEDNLLKNMESFLSTHHLWPHSTTGTPQEKKESCASKGDTRLQMEEPAHLLDHLLTVILKGFAKCPKSFYEPTITHRNLKDLQESGIRVKKNNSKNWPIIEFCGGHFRGELKLPAITVDDTTEPTLLNLIAYEMCPDVMTNYEISSFVAFLDSLIDHPEDVKILREEGVLTNALGSDEQVSKLFNT